jgi:hypothetical protein
MPILELTDAELHDAAQAARLAAKREQREAALQPNTRIRERFTVVARSYRRLAEKFDAARPSTAS